MAVFGTYPNKAADEFLRLREALERAGETCADARQIADEALAIWPQVDTFQTHMSR